VYVTALHKLVEATRVLEQAQYGPQFLGALETTLEVPTKHDNARRAFEDHSKAHGCYAQRLVRASVSALSTTSRLIAGAPMLLGSYSSPEDGHCALVRFTQAACFLPHVRTLEVVVVQQMIATVFKFVDSIEFQAAEWAHPGLV
jgi:hypothetical protein